MELEELLNAKRIIADSPLGPTISVRHPRLGIEIELSERAICILNIINKDTADDEYLIHRPKGQNLNETVALAYALRQRVISFLSQHKIRLFQSRSIFSDWLAFMRRKGLSESSAAKLAFARQPLANAPQREINELMAISNSAADDKGTLLKRWHVLCSYSPTLRSNDLKAQVCELLREKKTPFNRKQDLYDPQDIRKVERNGRMKKRNDAVVSRYLFVHCLADTAKLIDNANEKASLLRVLGSPRVFATVPHQDILQLAQILKDFREDVELIGLEMPLGPHGLAEGVRVRILTGPFKGFEGSIAEVIKKTKHNDEDDKLFKVSVDGFSMTANADITIKGIEIEAI